MADIETRLQQNKHSDRLNVKPTKRDILFSEGHLLETFQEHRLNSYEDELKRENYLWLKNINMKPAAALYIKEHFKL